MLSTKRFGCHLSDLAAVRTLAALVATVILATFAVAGQQKSFKEISAPQEVTQSSLQFHKEYVFAAGDSMEIVVRRAPEVSRVVSIRPDGYISLPLLQDIQAAGLTPSELAAKLTRLFSARLFEPEVYVLPTQVRQAMVYVTGELQPTSGVAIPFRDAPTAAQAIALAGGFRRSASMRHVTLIRLSADGHLQALPLESSTGGTSGIYMALRATLLQPDDIVFVPESARSQVERFIDDFINRPATAVNMVVGSYANFKLVEQFTK